VKNYTGKLDI